MSGDTKRSVLSDLRRPLLQPSSVVPAALEEKLLGGASSGSVALPAPEPRPVEPAPAAQSRAKAPTVPVTFHLAISLRDRLKITAQAQQRTMVEIASEALEEYLSRHPVSEADVRRLLGL